MDDLYLYAMIPLAVIETDDSYVQLFPSLSEKEYDALAESVRRVGILTPICVARRGDKYIVLDGHHRLKIAKTLGIHEIPCVVARDQAHEIELAYSCNLQRRHLSHDQRRTLEAEFQARLQTVHRETDRTVAHFQEALAVGKVPLDVIERLVASLPASQTAVAAETEPLRAQIAELQAKMDEAARQCRRLLNERDSLREAVELYERRVHDPVPSEHAVDAAVKHANKELVEAMRRLAEISQKLKAANDDRSRLEEELKRAKEREEIWSNGERRLLANELEQTQEENHRLHQLLQTHNRAVALLRGLKQRVEELGLLLDHTIDPWSEDERKPVAEAYAELVAAWESVREPFSLSLGGLPPGRSVFDRMFPDKRHREPLERFQEQQANAAAFADGPVQVGNGRKRVQKTSRRAHRHPEASLAAIDNMDPDILAEEIRREFGEEFDQILESDMPQLEQIAIDDLEGEADSV